MQSRPRVVIVGGGISGLATAHYMHRRLGAGVQLTLVESGMRLGGKVATQEFSGHLVDTGPDALLVRAPKIGPVTPGPSRVDTARRWLPCSRI